MRVNCLITRCVMVGLKKRVPGGNGADCGDQLFGRVSFGPIVGGLSTLCAPRFTEDGSTRSIAGATVRT